MVTQHEQPSEHARTRTHTHAHARTHTHTHTLTLCMCECVLVSHTVTSIRQRAAMSATHLGPLIESVADKMVRVGDLDGQDLVARENEQKMDLTYKRGLRDASELRAEGIYSEEEFMREKDILRKDYEARTGKRMRTETTTAAPTQAYRMGVATAEMSLREGSMTTHEFNLKQDTLLKEYENKMAALLAAMPCTCEECAQIRMCPHHIARSACKECHGTPHAAKRPRSAEGGGLAGGV